MLFFIFTSSLLLHGEGIRVGEDEGVGGRNDFMPIPSSIYGAPCPFAAWYNKCTSGAKGTPDCLPEGFKAEEQRQTRNVNTAWKEAGSETGIRQNDHNFNTDLGQGNTLGLVSATLTIDPAPPQVRHGLFATPGDFPAVVRFSDFGADYRDTEHFNAAKGMKRLMRMAVKVEQPSAWAGESNLLLTETLDSFPFADLNALATSAAGSPGLGNIGSVVGVFGEKLAIMSRFKETALTKDFYGQTPYALGKSAAMKFALKTKVPKCGMTRFTSSACCMSHDGSSEHYWQKRISELGEYLGRCDAVFELGLQTRPFSANCNPDAESDPDCFQVMKNASAAWGGYQRIGSLKIHKQTMTPENGVGQILQQALSEITGIEPDKVDKAFSFHPIMNHEDNRPVGEIGAFRAGFYSQNMKWRFKSMFKGVINGVQSAIRMPFEQLKQAGIWEGGNPLDGMRGDDDAPTTCCCKKSECVNDYTKDQNHRYQLVDGADGSVVCCKMRTSCGGLFTGYKQEEVSGHCIDSHIFWKAG